MDNISEFNSITFLVSSISLFLLSIFFKFLHKVLWTPIRIQNMLNKQGIKGPSYRFLHGNTKQVLEMMKEAMSQPLGLSHHIFPRIQPNIYSWIIIYGNKFFIFFITIYIHGLKGLTQIIFANLLVLFILLIFQERIL